MAQCPLNTSQIGQWQRLVYFSLLPRATRPTIEPAVTLLAILSFNAMAERIFWHADAYNVCFSTCFAYFLACGLVAKDVALAAAANAVLDCHQAIIILLSPPNFPLSLLRAFWLRWLY
jgi:hypothetical protein